MDETTRDTAKHQAEGDVLRLKQMEAQTRRMNKVFMDGADPIVIRDLDGNVIDLNRETERVFGWNRDELLGGRTRHLLTPEYRATGDEIFRSLERGETVRNAEAAVTTKQGNVIPVLVTAFLLTDENDQPVGSAQIIKNITELKETTSKLEQRNRELQQFASVLAHDLGAPLRSIRGFIELLKSDCGGELNEDCQSHLHFILDTAQRMERLINDLLSYARIEDQQSPYVAVDCERAFQQAVANLHAAISDSHAEITADPLPTIQANPTQMVQLFQNLIDNAIKYRRSAHASHSCFGKPRGERLGVCRSR